MTASDLNAEFNNIINDYNGNITTANLAQNTVTGGATGDIASGTITDFNLAALTAIPFGTSVNFQNASITWMSLSNTGDVSFYV